jgi:hypothetical protein
MADDWAVFEYCYRDASNYRARVQVFLRGQASPTIDVAFRAAMDGGEYFDAEAGSKLTQRRDRYDQDPRPAPKARDEDVRIHPPSLASLRTGAALRLTQTSGANTCSQRHLRLFRLFCLLQLCQTPSILNCPPRKTPKPLGRRCARSPNSVSPTGRVPFACAQRKMASTPP